MTAHDSDRPDEEDTVDEVTSGDRDDERSGDMAALAPAPDSIEAPEPRRALPTDDELELVSYKVGSYISDLDDILCRIKRQTSIVSIEDGLAAIERGEPAPERTPLDHIQLARIVIFATDAISDAESIGAAARELRSEAVHLYHDEVDADRDGEGYKRYRHIVAEWHRTEVREGL